MKDKEISLINKGPVEKLVYKNHPYRFVVFVIYMLQKVLIGTFCVAFPPITPACEKLYNVTKSIVVMSSTFFFLGNVIPAPFTFPIIKHFGLRKTICFATFSAFLGTVVRLFMNYSFHLTFISQIFMGVCSVLVENILLEFCKTWFCPSTRGIYLGILCLMNILGGGLGSTIPLLFVNNQEDDLSVLKAQMDRYNYWAFVVMSILFIVTLFLFRDKPPKGYGYINRRASIFSETEDRNFFIVGWEYLKVLFSKKNFISYYVVYIISCSTLVFFNSVINLVAIYFGYNSVS